MENGGPFFLEPHGNDERLGICDRLRHIGLDVDDGHVLVARDGRAECRVGLGGEAIAASDYVTRAEAEGWLRERFALYGRERAEIGD